MFNANAAIRLVKAINRLKWFVIAVVMVLGVISSVSVAATVATSSGSDSQGTLVFGLILLGSSLYSLFTWAVLGWLGHMLASQVAIASNTEHKTQYFGS